MRNQTLMSGRTRVTRSLSIILAAAFVTTVPAASSAAQQRTERAVAAVISPQQRAYDRAYGLYNLAGTLAPEFGSLSEMEIFLQPRTATRDRVRLGDGIEGVLSFDEMLARPKRTTTRGADGRLFTLILDREHREHRLTELSVTADALSFTTAEAGGTSFRFNGRFTNTRPTRRHRNPVALEGTLEKLVGRQIVAEQRLRFTKFWD